MRKKCAQAQKKCVRACVCENFFVTLQPNWYLCRCARKKAHAKAWEKRVRKDRK